MMGVRGLVAGTFALGILFLDAPSWADSENECGAALARQPLLVSKASKEALRNAKRSGILEARLILQIPSADARGVLPPYVRLMVERDRVKAALEAGGATVHVIETDERTAARLTLGVIGPYEAVLKEVLANRWVARLITGGNVNGPAKEVVFAPANAAREQAALVTARAQALRPTSLELEERIVATIRDGYTPDPTAVEVALLGTVDESSFFLATIPVDNGAKRHSLAFLLRLEQRDEAYDVHVDRVLTPDELSVFLP